MSLSLENGSVIVNNKELLRDVSISCGKGQLVCILGENGAGKSTLLNAVAGQRPLSGGQVLLDGEPIETFTSRELAQRRAVLPQSVELTFPLDVAEVVRLALCFAPISLDTQDVLIEQCLKTFSVSHLIERNYLNLSGGEKQRVQLARVVAQIRANQLHYDRVHQYLLLDEPIAALDLHQQYTALKAIKELCDDGLCVVAILHDLNIASLFADTIYILKGGQLLSSGSPKAVISEDNIKAAFSLDAVIKPHPEIDTPMVIPRIKD
ncbi:MAG: heme ABC transporter ATP-binding protein [Pseudomonadota bacterium]